MFIRLMIKIAKVFFPPSWLATLYTIYDLPGRLDGISKDINKLIMLYNNPEKQLSQKETLKANEFKIYSQFGEDGILLYIFSKIGTTDKTFVEIGAGVGQECNSANLSLNFGWNGVMIDGGAINMDCAKSFYDRKLGIQSDKVKTIKAFITAENVNKIIAQFYKGEIDFLSIDIDGIDYWIWQALDIINPRVVVMEHNSCLGKEKSLTVKYSPDFERFKYDKLGLYYGASLAALDKLAVKKGYILIGCESNGANAFFVRKDIAYGKFNRLTTKKAYYPDAYRAKLMTLKEQENHIKQLSFVKV